MSEPTQQRTEEGEVPREYPENLYCVVHIIGDGKRTFQKQTIFDFKPKGEHRAYVPASRVTALELELERAKTALREIANPDVSDWADAAWLVSWRNRAKELAGAALRDLGEGQ